MSKLFCEKSTASIRLKPNLANCEYKNDDLAFVRYGGHNATTLYGLGTFVCIHPKQTVHSYNITSAIPQIRLVKLNTVYP